MKGVEGGTKTVPRMLLPWNVTREERWLEEQARSGWHMKAMRCYGYTFEKGAPAEVAYRLDFGPPRRRDRAEYFALFRDAGWEHLGTRGLWQAFRKGVVDGQAPEIYTDPQSRIAMYRRVIGLLSVFLAVMITQIGPRLAENHPASAAARYPAILALQLSMAAVLVYGIVRLLLVIVGLRRAGTKQAG